MKKNFIEIAKGLGIAIPVCLLASTAEAGVAKMTTIEDAISLQKVTSLKAEKNPVKDRIIQAFNEEEVESPYQIAHTNAHANYNVPHTNVHSNYMTGNDSHVDSHSNTRGYHVDDHSNSKI